MCLCYYCVVFLYNHKTQDSWDLFGFLLQNTKNTNQHLGQFFYFLFYQFFSGPLSDVRGRKKNN